MIHSSLTEAPTISLTPAKWKKPKAKPKPKSETKPKKSKEITHFTPSGKLSNSQHEKFCTLYTTKHLGNATQSYLEVYKCDYETAKTNGSALLTNTHNKERIRLLLDKQGFTDENADANHLYIINQFEDLPSKMRAIEQYNKLKRRIEDVPQGPTIYIVDHVKLQKIKDLQARIERQEAEKEKNLLTSS